MEAPRPGMQALVYDLGGTHLRCGVTDHRGVIQQFRKERIACFLDGHDPASLWGDLLSRMVEYERSVRALLRADSPCVFAFPGPIRGHREILNAPTLFGDVRQFPDVCTELEGRIGRPVHILNDVSAAGFYLSTQTRAKRFMVVTVSSGIGSKLYDRCHPAGVIDDPPFAGEIGHLVVDWGRDTPQCDCGGTGHLGAIASGRGVERAARRQARLDPPAFSRSDCVRLYGAVADDLSNETHLIPALRGGDEWALPILRSCTRPLARVVLSVLMGAGLEQVLIIGGFALSLGQPYLEVLRSLITEESDYSVVAEGLREMIALSQPNEEACLEGAAVYARRLTVPA
jgi:predicted NBD/HSP70 family sugar kinase